MDGKLIILGCGGSAGVPTIGNWWGACDPAEPRNARTRPSIAIQTQTSLLIVDTGPDFREQMNREHLGAPDAIIITHAHSDHINGLDELRTLQRMKKRKFPLYTSQQTFTKLDQVLGYMFKTSHDGFYPAVCDPVILNMGEVTTIGDIPFTAFEQDHGSIKSLGVRLGNVGYSTDAKSFGPQAMEILTGVKTWIVDAAGHYSETNPVHLAISEIIELNKTIGAEKIYLTHLPPSMDYRTLLKELPRGYEPAYDGMTLDINF